MLVLLSGVSGSGKDTIKKELMKRMENVDTFASYTDRLMRPGETEGHPFHFISTEKFEAMIKNKEFYEYDVHHKNYYGVHKQTISEKLQSGKIIVKDMDVNGTETLLNLLDKKVKVVTIFLRVPKEQLIKRLENRIDNPSPKEIKLRLNRFDYEESRLDLYDYVIKNNDLEKTVQIIMTIIENENNLNNAEF